MVINLKNLSLIICTIFISILLPYCTAAGDEKKVDDKSSMVELSFPDQLELKVLIDYVAKRNGINFMYDGRQIAGRTVTINAPEKVPAESLMLLLESALKMNGFVMCKDETGMTRIEMARPLTAISTGPAAASAVKITAKRPTMAVTKFFELKYASPNRIEEIIKPFLSAATANLISLPEHGVIVITDYSDNMQRLVELVALLDRPKLEISTKFIPIVNMDAEEMSKKVGQLIAGRTRAIGATGNSGGNVTVLSDERTNQLAVVGAKSEVESVIEIIKACHASEY